MEYVNQLVNYLRGKSVNQSVSQSVGWLQKKICKEIRLQFYTVMADRTHQH